MSGVGDFVSIPARVSSGWTGAQEAEELVTNRFDLVNTYARETFDITEDYINQLDRLLESLVVPDASDINVDVPDIPSIDYDARPVLGDSGIDFGNWPTNDTTDMTLIPMPVFSDVTWPIASFTEPVWNNPVPPVLNAITDPGDMPTLADVTVPTAPAIVLPAPPVLDTILIPAAPALTIPDFTATFTPAALINPAPFVWGDPLYVADDAGQIWTSLLAKVLFDIVNGGTGLNAAVEADLYQRYLDRTTDENARLLDTATNYWAARGWTIPPGMLAGQIAEANQQISRNNMTASRDITISQAELAQKNTHFVMEQGAKLEGMMRDFYTTNTNRLFEAAKFTAQNAIDLFNALVGLHNAEVEAYKTEAAIYDARVRGALASVELFKGQIEGAKVSSELQKNLVDVYKAQLSAAESQMKLYVSEMEGAKIAMELSTAQLEGYKIKTQAFIARLDGEKSKLGVYEAELSAEKTKAEVYSQQVGAYVAQVGAVESTLKAQVAQLEAAASVNKNEIDRYRAELSGYEVEIKARASTIEAQVEGFKSECMAYDSQTKADATYYEVLISGLKARVEVARLNMEKFRAEIEATSSSYIKIKELQVEGTKGIMNVGAQLTASALNAVNASASYGFSGSRGFNESEGESISWQGSLSESHSYDETK